MKVDAPFLKLPINFSAERLEADVRALPDRAWQPHPQGFEGNEAVPLISPHGHITDAIDGPMAPTEHLLSSPYLLEVMRALGATWGRSRLMALAAGAEVPAHSDIHYYWRTHYRVHIPVITNPGVEFTCDGQTVHMKPGECWIPDTFRRHEVQNKGDARRIHLVMDTVGGERFWDLMDAARSGTSAPADQFPRFPADDLQFEQINSSRVMPPYELQYHVENLSSHIVPYRDQEALTKLLDRFVAAWFSAWARFGPSDEGVPTFGSLLIRCRRDVAQLCGEKVMLDNGRTFFHFFEHFLLASAVSRENFARITARPEPAFRQTAVR